MSSLVQKCLFICEETVDKCIKKTTQGRFHICSLLHMLRTKVKKYKIIYRCIVFSHFGSFSHHTVCPGANLLKSCWNQNCSSTSRVRTFTSFSGQNGLVRIYRQENFSEIHGSKQREEEKSADNSRQHATFAEGLLRKMQSSSSGSAL